MKKILIAIVAMMLCINANAQLRTSRTFYKKEGRATEWILRAGLSLNNMAGLDINEYNDAHKGSKSISLGTKAGFAIDLGFNKYFGQSNLYWGMELGIGTRGMSATFDTHDRDDEWSSEKTSFSAYNIKFSPFTIGYKIPVTDEIKIDPHIGLFATYDVSSSADEDYFYGYDSSDYKFDAGVQLGVGVWYGKINLDLMYQRGFCEAFYIDALYDGTAVASNFLIRLGYAF